MTWWRVAPEWAGETAFIVAGGTSVHDQDLSLLRGRRVIVVNSSYEAVPFADILFFGDFSWWEAHRRRDALLGFAGRIVTVSLRAAGRRLLRLRRQVPPPGLSCDPRSVVSERTSLQGAINLAVHLGVKRIVLLGADMRRADDGRSHHHSPHPRPNKPGNRTWDIQMAQLQLVVEPLRALGIEVINTSPISRIDWWPRAELAACLAQ
jgi:hypothetical protein